MWFRDKIRRSPGEALDQCAEILNVGSKFHWTRASSLLVDFRSSLEPMRPLDRSPEREPFHEHARKRDSSEHGRQFTHVEPEAVAQMTDHVVGRHITPATLSGWLNGVEPAENFLFVGGMEGRLHNRNRSGLAVLEVF